MRLHLFSFYKFTATLSVLYPVCFFFVSEPVYAVGSQTAGKTTGSLALMRDKVTSAGTSAKHIKRDATVLAAVPGSAVASAGTVAVKGSAKALGATRNSLTATGALVDPDLRAPNEPLSLGQERVDVAFDKSNEPVILCAVSGGGSRAAYYTAAVFEQLASTPDPIAPGKSVMDRVRVLSAVSGGSLAAAYYAVNFDKRNEPGFYTEFKDRMARNLEGRMYAEMLLWPPTTLETLFTDKTRTDVLAGFVENTLHRNYTFDDLQAQYLAAPSHGKPPILVVNGTIWNTGSRLVMTNLPPSRFPIPMSEKTLYSDPDMPSAYRRTVGILRPVHFETFGSNIGTFSVANAVSASMAYPIFLAPFNLKVYPQCIPATLEANLPERVQESPWIQVTDGGVFANDGADSLFSLLKTIPKNKPVLILYVQGGFGLEPMASKRGRIWGLTSVVNRMYDISNSRPMALYLDTSKQLHDPSKVMILPITLGGYSSDQSRRLLNIPTALRLNYGNRKLLDKIVPQNTADMVPSIQEALYVLSGKKGRNSGFSQIKKSLVDMENRRVVPEF